MTRATRGFTLIELLIVVVVGSIVLLATLQVLTTNQRIYTAHNARVQGSQSTRAALAVLTSELREISPPGGDLVMMDVDSLRVRAMRALGVICHDTVLGIAEFRAFQIGDSLVVGDSVFVFADNNSLKSWDDAWILTTVSAANYGVTCAGGNGQQLTFASTAPFFADSVSSGAEVRAFTHITYGLMQDGGGDWYLGQRVSGGGWTPAVGPVLPNRGVSFVYLDEFGNTTTTATEVAMIDVSVRTGADVIGPTGNLVVDSVTVRIHTRN